MQKFCEARSLGFMTEKDARQIVDSGYPIETISTKKTKCDDSGPFECLFCPLVQNCRKFFGVKEKHFKEKITSQIHNKVQQVFDEVDSSIMASTIDQKLQEQLKMEFEPIIKTTVTKEVNSEMDVNFRPKFDKLTNVSLTPGYRDKDASLAILYSTIPEASIL